MSSIGGSNFTKSDHAVTAQLDGHAVAEPAHEQVIRVGYLVEMIARETTSADAGPPLPNGQPSIDGRLTGRADDTLDEGRHRRMFLIRRFEERLLGLFEAGLLQGTTHACIGQEANSVAVMEHLRPGDHVFSNHRGHGHFLAWTGDVAGLLAEITGQASGVCGGIGGSQHLYAEGFASNGILGGTIPAAAGIAWARQLDNSDGISVVFTGDGALGEGIVYETLNLASLWKLPLLVVVENNRYAQSTPIEVNLAGSIAVRFNAFDIATREVSSFDVAEISTVASDAVAAVRTGNGPQALVIDTYRLCHHSKNDDNRPIEEVDRYRALEPLVVQARWLSPERRGEIENQVDAALDEVFEMVLAGVEH